MKKLDIYIARQFISNIIFALFMFVTIIVIINLVERLSNFLEKGATTSVIAEYYLYYIPEVVTLTMPFALLMACLFCVGKLSKYNELLAMKASGISLLRILTPIIVVATAISFGMIYFGEVVMPAANTYRSEIKMKYIDKRKSFSNMHYSNLIIQDKENRKIFIGSYNGLERTARKISMQEFDGINVIKRMDAESMRWQDGWVLTNVWIRDFANGEKVDSLKTMIFSDLAMNSTELGDLQKDPMEMNYAELEAFIEDIAINGGNPDHWLVDLYLKISFPFANLVLILFGAPLAASSSRSTGATGFALAIIVCLLYFLSVKGGQTFGQTGKMDPLLAAWLGNIIFGVSSLLMFKNAPK